MSTLTANGIPVLSGTMVLPLSGVWTADIVLDHGDMGSFGAGAAITIASDAGGEWRGVVAPGRAGEYLDSLHLRVVGGKGGMGTVATPASYAQPGALAADVIRDLLSDAGESLSGDASADVQNHNLIAWATTAMPCSAALSLLLRLIDPDLHWRVLADGTIWLGAETWPTTAPELTILQSNPIAGDFEIGSDSIAIQPGVTIDGIGRIARVEHQLMPHSIRARLWIDTGEDRGMRAAVAGVVRAETARIDYYARYTGEIKSQGSDGTVDITPDDPRLPGLGRVPLYAPGLLLKVAPGAKALIGWSGGDPTQPYAELRDTSITEIDIGGSGGDAVVTVQDLDAIKMAISSAGVTPMDGGATFKSNIVASWPPMVGSLKIKAVR